MCRRVGCAARTPQGGTTPVAGRAPPRVTRSFSSATPFASARCPISRRTMHPGCARSSSAHCPRDVLFTDGEVDDPDALAAVPAGSQVVVINPGASPDAAVSDIQAPRAVIGNDTAEFRIAIATGRAGAGEGTLSLVIGDQRVASTPVQALAAFGERTVTARARVPNVPGATLVRAIVAAAGDREPRNDTLTTVLEVSPAAGAVLVSTSP